MYSAKKQGGQKLYELARRGEEVERNPVRVCIYVFEPLKTAGQLVKDNLDGTFDFQVRVVCSSGTYVRTLAEDFGKRLGVGAHLAELRRTRVADLHISVSITLEELQTSFGEEALGTVLLSPDSALSRLPFVHLSADDARKARHGMEVSVSEAEWPGGEMVRMRDADGHLIAVGKFDASHRSLHPSVVIAQEKQALT